MSKAIVYFFLPLIFFCTGCGENPYKTFSASFALTENEWKHAAILYENIAISFPLSEPDFELKKKELESYGFTDWHQTESFLNVAYKGHSFVKKDDPTIYPILYSISHPGKGGISSVVLYFPKKEEIMFIYSDAVGG